MADGVDVNFDSKDYQGDLVAVHARATAIGQPINTCVVRVDGRGNLLTQLAASAIVAVTADTTVTGTTFLPALTARRWLLFENLSDDTDVQWCFGTSVTVGEAFRLGPRGRVLLQGDLPNDAVRVITTSGTANLVGQQA